MTTNWRPVSTLPAKFDTLLGRTDEGIYILFDDAYPIVDGQLVEYPDVVEYCEIPK